MSGFVEYIFSAILCYLQKLTSGGTTMGDTDEPQQFETWDTKQLAAARATRVLAIQEIWVINIKPGFLSNVQLGHVWYIINMQRDMPA